MEVRRELERVMKALNERAGKEKQAKRFAVPRPDRRGQKRRFALVSVVTLVCRFAFLLDRFSRVTGRESRPAQPPARVALTRGSGGAVSENQKAKWRTALLRIAPCFRRPILVVIGMPECDSQPTQTS